jgi:transcriptional regulator with XRE-family HTH domain
MTKEERLKREMDKNGYTQTEVANKTGLSPATINNYFKRNNKNSTISKVCKVMGFDTDYILYGKEK